MWLKVLELQAKLLSILADFRRNPWIGYHTSHNCIMFHSFRRGQPAATQARSSSDRHKVERPMRMGWGILPAASHIRNVRTDVLSSTAAWGARSRKGL